MLFNSSATRVVFMSFLSFSGEPVKTGLIASFNPTVSDAGAPFPATTPPLGPEFVTARFTGTFTPKISGEYRFVSNADDYVGLWVNGVEEIAWSGHTAKDRFSTRAFQLVKDVPMHLRIDYRQDKLGYKLTLRLARQPEGEQRDLDASAGTFAPRWPDVAMMGRSDARGRAHGGHHRTGAVSTIDFLRQMDGLGGAY